MISTLFILLIAGACALPFVLAHNHYQAVRPWLARLWALCAALVFAAVVFPLTLWSYHKQEHSETLAAEAQASQAAVRTASLGLPPLNSRVTKIASGSYAGTIWAVDGEGDGRVQIKFQDGTKTWFTLPAFRRNWTATE